MQVPVLVPIDSNIFCHRAVCGYANPCTRTSFSDSHVMIQTIVAGTLPTAQGAGDVFLMRVILHDWSDEQALRILKNVRAAIGARTPARLGTPCTTIACPPGTERLCVDNESSV